MFRFLFRLIWFGFLGTLAAALVAKLTLRSFGEPRTQEVDLVSIFEGRTLVSEADPFYGGKVLTLFGGLLLDLRKANPSPTGIHLDLLVLMGGVQLVVPIGWRVEFSAYSYGGGFDDATRTTSDPDAPIVRVTGKLILGGFQATTKSPVEAVA